MNRGLWWVVAWGPAIVCVVGLILIMTGCVSVDERDEHWGHAHECAPGQRFGVDCYDR